MGKSITDSGITDASPVQATDRIPIGRPGSTAALYVPASQFGGGSSQPLDSDLTAIAALTTTAYGRAFLALADAAAARTAAGLGSIATQAADAVAITGGTISGVPISQNSQSAAYTTVLADAGKHILHPSSDNNARTFTIDSNANVAYQIGTAITFVNDANVLTIAITADTMVLAGGSSTGNRTLAATGVATALKIGTTRWVISGSGLT